MLCIEFYLCAFLCCVLITLLCALSITEDKLRKKRVIFRGKDGAAASSSSGDEMNQSRAPRPLDGASGASHQSTSGMAIRVVEFSIRGYKIRKIFA